MVTSNHQCVYYISVDELACRACYVCCFAKKCLVRFIRNEDFMTNVILCHRQDVVVRRGSRGGVGDQSTMLLPIK